MRDRSFLLHTVGLDLMIMAGIVCVIDFAGITPWSSGKGAGEWMCHCFRLTLIGRVKYDPLFRK
jgi:hypothetical protein